MSLRLHPDGRLPTRVGPLLLVAFLAVGCGSDPEGSGSTTDVTVDPDTGGGDTGGLGDTTDTTGTADAQPDSVDTGSGSTDVAEPDTSETTDTEEISCPGGFGCPCVSNGECDEGQCIETPEGKQCTKTCVDSCPDGFSCVLSGSGSDTISICVFSKGNLCSPCNKNSECQITGHSDARCVDQGDAGAFCGTGCSSDSNCAEGYSCQEVTDIAGAPTQQCVLKSGVCGCTEAAIKKELSTVCYNSVGDAKCAGTRTCLADGKPGAPAGGGLTSCVAAKPEAEACDGQDNDCDGETDESTCDDNEQCTTDSCDPKEGCKHANKQGSCDADGSECTENDSCQDGKCVTGKVVTCDDGNPCTKDVCDAAKGCTYEPTEGGCNADDNPCTPNDACKDGKCEKGPTKACESESPCVTGACSIVSGECKYQVTDGFACNDGNSCTANSKCDGEICKGTPVPCDDLDVCTSDSCDPKAGCKHDQLSGPCDDGNPCTGSDVCASGTCAGAPIDVAKICGDNNDCTSDSCDPKSGCKNALLDGTDCDDGNACTSGDKCTKGSCISGKNTCECTTDADCAKLEDGNLCNGTLYCDKSGQLWGCKIDAKTIVTCDATKDGPCETSSCTPSTGKCDKAPKADGTACDADGSVCTKDDACKSGACVAGLQLSCDDNNPCTDDACNAQAGCSNVANTAPCDADGDACTENDTCKDKACVAGAAKSCDDNEQCTDDSCDTKTGDCQHAKKSGSCDDGNPCTTTDTCGDGATSYTCLAGPAKDCDDKLSCTVDSCDEKTGECVNTSAVGQPVACYSGAPGTEGKGICKAGTQTCTESGQLTACSGEVLPLQKEVCGNGKDDTCDGITDEGCAPTGVSGRMASASIDAAAGNGAKYGMRASAGASLTAGEAKGQGNTVLDAGFYAWLKAWLGGK
ncbi:MAG: hypothetical protein H6747_17070 [Deltaproteobacteria bacterium]|nr:hypothetical protein [Deltaproteobacteria bacterium]